MKREDLMQIIPGLTQNARKIKEETVADPDTINDVPVMMTAYREGYKVPVAAAASGEGLGAVVGPMLFMISGLEATLLVVLSEGYGSDLEINPATGVAWEERDMQYRIETTPGQTEVYRCLFMHLLVNPKNADTDKPHYGASIPYRLNGKTVEWLTDSDTEFWWSDDGDPFSIPHAKDFFDEDPTVRAFIKEQMEKNSDEGPMTQAMFEELVDSLTFDLLLDMFIMKNVREMDGMISGGLLYENDTEREYYYDKAFGDSYAGQAMRALLGIDDNEVSLRKIVVGGSE